MNVLGETKIIRHIASLIKYRLFLILLPTILAYNAKAQSTAKDIKGPAAVVPLLNEPAPKLVADAPLADQLALGRVIIQYRTENLRIEPVFGPAALNVSPRIGHIHVTVDDAPWHWADASDEPIIIVGMKPGPHKVLIQMADPTHKVLQEKTLYFTVPEQAQARLSYH